MASQLAPSPEGLGGLRPGPEGWGEGDLSAIKCNPHPHPSPSGEGLYLIPFNDCIKI
jgi:hypothetical protein